MNSFFQQFLFLAIATGFIAISPAFSQAILKEREWTNPDGKKIRAELLEFEEDLVRLRLKGGNTFKVKPESLSRVDQAVILKAKFDAMFRSFYSESMGAHFFYSKQVAKSENDKTVAYIGNDYKSAWTRIKISAHADLVKDGVKVVFMGENVTPLRINYGPDDTERIRANSVIDLSLTKHIDEISRLFANPEKTKLYIETVTGTYTEVKLSNEEKLGIKEVSSAFKTLSTLTTDPVWWTTFQGLDPREFEKMVAEKAASQKTAEVPVDQGPVLPLQEWGKEGTGGMFEAEVTGFDRHKAVFRLKDGTVQSLPVEDLNRAGREILVTGRMNQSVYEGWHPYDDEHSWFWPKKWTTPGERIEKQVVLFVTNRETGEPGLYLQLCLETDTAESVMNCKLLSKEVFLELELPTGSGVMKLRGTTSTKVWLHLSEESVGLLLVAAPGMEGLEYAITPASGLVQAGKFSEEEYAASVEALEIYRIRKSLHDRKPGDAVSEPVN